jgi:hypothetical protein
MVGNRPTCQVDKLGLRVVTIHIYYNISESIVNDRVKKLFERMFQDCFAFCKDPCDKVKFDWKKVSGMKDLKLGTRGTVLGTGFYPSDVGKYVEDDPNLGVVGYNQNNYTAINSSTIISQSQNLNLDQDVAVATTLAHEIGFHGIGGDTDWWLSTPTDWEGNPNTLLRDQFIDSNTPNPRIGIQFSKQACKEICDELDIDELW